MASLFSCSQQQANVPDAAPSQSNGQAADFDPAPSGKVFNDPVHGHFRLEAACIAMIDTRQFQRLRWLKQLGLAYHVFPGASHNRFEHSLGVAWQAHQMASRLYESQKSLDMDPIDITLVSLAGLCHDLGHGPFSHVFENELLPKLGVPRGRWHHEAQSNAILDHLIDANHLDLGQWNILDSDVAHIKALMTGTRPGGAGSAGKRFLFDIVANKRNSIDVDKFDYLRRDSHYSGVAISCDSSRLMEFCRVIDDEICFKWSEYGEIHQLFYDRARMHQKVYTHRKAKAIEFMLCDALVAAEPVLGIRDKLEDVEAYLSLDDHIIRQLEALRPEACECPGRIREAQAVLSALHRRQLYCYCDEVVVPYDKRLLPKPSAADITTCQAADGLVTLSPGDIVVAETKIDFAARDLNPLDNVSFFQTNAAGSFHLRPEQVSTLLNQTYQERRIRVYCKHRDDRMIDAVRRAFDGWSKRTFGSDVEMTTPCKGGKKRARSDAGLGELPAADGEAHS